MITRRYPVWRRATDLPLLRDLAFLPWWVEFRAVENSDYHLWPLDLDSFTTGRSDYEVLSDEINCPCGAILYPWDGTAGEMLRMIYGHCEASGHPKPRYEP